MGKDDTFTESLKLYSASLELAAISSGLKKATYEKKAAEHLVVLNKWLRENLLNAVEVTYQGVRAGNWSSGSRRRAKAD